MKLHVITNRNNRTEQAEMSFEAFEQIFSNPQLITFVGALAIGEKIEGAIGNVTITVIRLMDEGVSA